MKMESYMAIAQVLTPRKEKKLSFIDRLMAYEDGELDEQQTVQLFDEAMTTGLLCGLQGHYGRVAQDLKEKGLIEEISNK
jgi:hypothetical protein